MSISDASPTAAPSQDLRSPEAASRLGFRATAAWRALERLRLAPASVPSALDHRQKDWGPRRWRAEYVPAECLLMFMAFHRFFALTMSFGVVSGRVLHLPRGGLS